MEKILTVAVMIRFIEEKKRRHSYIIKSGGGITCDSEIFRV